MSQMRWVAALALIPLGLAACSAGSASTSSTTATEQPAAQAEESVPPSLEPQPETSQSPTATATIDPNAKVIYLTFDDGPWVTYTQQILDILAEHDAKATFFVVGEMAQQHMGLIKKEYEAGHAVGNHTWNHADLTTLSDAGIHEDLLSVGKLLGEYGAPCMRPPYGSTNDRVRAITKEAGYRTVLWTDWAVDWEQPPVPQLMNYLKEATEGRPPGPPANILLHDGGGDRPNTVEAVRQMIPKWIKQGYTFEPVPACLKPTP